MAKKFTVIFFWGGVGCVFSVGNGVPIDSPMGELNVNPARGYMVSEGSGVIWTHTVSLLS